MGSQNFRTISPSYFPGSTGGAPASKPAAQPHFKSTHSPATDSHSAEPIPKSLEGFSVNVAISRAPWISSLAGMLDPVWHVLMSLEKTAQWEAPGTTVDRLC